MVAEAHSAIAILDLDGDGKISRTELMAAAEDITNYQDEVRTSTYQAS
jgi:Ca2+-binding EF-hand superfamily protein